jgi:hypothetical protein
VSEEPSLFLYRDRTGASRGIFPSPCLHRQHHHQCSQWEEAGPSRWHGGRTRAWAGPPRPYFPCCFLSGLGPAWVGLLGLVLLWLWLVALPFGPLRFLEKRILLLFHLFSVSVSVHQFYWYKWKQVSSTGICVYECMFSSFLELCWWYKCVDNVRQQGVVNSLY